VWAASPSARARPRVTACPQGLRPRPGQQLRTGRRSDAAPSPPRTSRAQL
jgi:hypothetical protein